MDDENRGFKALLQSLTLNKLKIILEKEKRPRSGLKADVVNRILASVAPHRALLHIHDEDVVSYAQGISLEGPLNIDGLSGDSHEYADICRRWLVEEVWKVSSQELIPMEDTEPLVLCLPQQTTANMDPTRLDEIKTAVLGDLFSALRNVYAMGDKYPILRQSRKGGLLQLAELETTSSPSSDTDLTLAFQGVSRLFWETADSRIRLPAVNAMETQVDVGKDRVVATVCWVGCVFEFQPHMGEAIIQVEQSGSIYVECPGIWYTEGEPRGPFRIRMGIVESSPGRSDSASASFWCIKRLDLEFAH